MCNNERNGTGAKNERLRQDSESVDFVGRIRFYLFSHGARTYDADSANVAGCLRCSFVVVGFPVSSVRFPKAL